MCGKYHVDEPLCKSNVSNGTLRSFERRILLTARLLDASVFFFNASPVPVPAATAVAVPCALAAVVVVDVADGAADEDVAAAEDADTALVAC